MPGFVPYSIFLSLSYSYIFRIVSGGMLYASILITIGLLPQAAEAAVACNETHNPCEVLLWKGSECQGGFCTNPLQGGCLRALLGSEEYEEHHSDTNDALRRRLLSRPRVCNSEDGPDVIERGLCVKNEAEYPEVRIYSQVGLNTVALSLNTVALSLIAFILRTGSLGLCYHGLCR